MSKTAIEYEGLPEFTRARPDHCEGFQGPCENTEARWGHKGTLYYDVRENWAYLCEECWQHCSACWHDQWVGAMTY